MKSTITITKTVLLASALRALDLKRRAQEVTAAAKQIKKSPNKGQATNPHRHLKYRRWRPSYELKMQRMLLGLSRKQYDKYRYLIRKGHTHTEAMVSFG